MTLLFYKIVFATQVDAKIKLGVAEVLARRGQPYIVPAF
jgi:hypothetical protein